MENHFEIINQRLERIELLLEQLVPLSIEKNIIKKGRLKNKIPTEEEMDAYLMTHVFSKKKK